MSKRQPKFEPIPNYGDHMAWDDFVSSCQDEFLTDDDGFGELATSDKVSGIKVDPSRAVRDSYKRPDWATHVVWYNK